VLALEGIESIGDDLGYGVWMFESYDIDRSSGARPET
jgi:hypothetical protein